MVRQALRGADEGRPRHERRALGLLVLADGEPGDRVSQFREERLSSKRGRAADLSALTATLGNRRAFLEHHTPWSLTRLPALPGAKERVERLLAQRAEKPLPFAALERAAWEEIGKSLRDRSTLHSRAALSHYMEEGPRFSCEFDSSWSALFKYPDRHFENPRDAAAIFRTWELYSREFVEQLADCVALSLRTAPRTGRGPHVVLEVGSGPGFLAPHLHAAIAELVPEGLFTYACADDDSLLPGIEKGLTWHGHGATQRILDGVTKTVAERRRLNEGSGIAHHSLDAKDALELVKPTVVLSFWMGYNEELLREGGPGWRDVRSAVVSGPSSRCGTAELWCGDLLPSFEGRAILEHEPRFPYNRKPSQTELFTRLE